jgi:hypothetical protein
MQYQLINNFVKKPTKFISQFSEQQTFLKRIKAQHINSKWIYQGKEKKEKAGQAGSGQAEPDPGRIQPSWPASQPRAARRTGTALWPSD